MQTVQIAAFDLYTQPFVQVDNLVSNLTSVYLASEDGAVPLEIHLSPPASEEPASSAIARISTQSFRNNACARPSGSLWLTLCPGQCATLPEGFRGPLWVRPEHRPNTPVARVMRTNTATGAFLQSRGGVGTVGGNATTNAAEQTLVKISNLSLVFGTNGRGVVSPPSSGWFSQSLKLPGLDLNSDVMDTYAPNAGLTFIGVGAYGMLAPATSQLRIVNPFSIALPGILLQIGRAHV